ncbi:hypothetical protein [Paenibacillus cremeus]|uniref:Uncharacterized protein n=1 Tax=Paenibacillus cremeus TaxID=2163881 RepID=A0A559KIK7_9BACL|nr:hypothetical protein [Paenibacillus cremeus]TVY11974.1 hypothetical protein FPZ49_01465 [Paenibacillus cremeus]
MIVYDTRFNSNEWFILGGLVLGFTVIYFLPKRFSKKHAVVYFMCGVFSGFFFDHSLSVEPRSFYDVNDTSKYEFMDFLSYFSYGSISYLFFYFYDRLYIHTSAGIAVYVLGWSLLSVGIEWLAVLVGVFHYQLGYKLAYSFPIYLIVQTCWVAFFCRYRKISEA